MDPNILFAIFTAPEFKALLETEIESLLAKQGVSSAVRPFLALTVSMLVEQEITKLTQPH